ncbi:MAG TPA: hypothetical protein VEV87_05635 [Chitinophagaceae bacterium]|nr:hypothetical protein [Chitinophagaceae bacterium]
MKKLLLVLAVGAFVACNNSGSTDSTSDTASKATDTTVVTPDTTVIKVDTTARPDTTKK